MTVFPYGLNGPIQLVPYDTHLESDQNLKRDVLCILTMDDIVQVGRGSI